MTDRDRAAVADVHDPIRHPLDEQVVGDHDRRCALAPDERLQQGHELRGGSLVQLRGRLVGEEEARPRREGRRERDPLLLAAGELAWRRRAAITEPDLLEELRRPRAHARQRPSPAVGAAAPPRHAPSGTATASASTAGR